jgi:hypothetical protein
MTLLRNVPDTVTAVHFCPECYAAYDSYDEAVACTKINTPKPKFSVGDIIVGGPEYHWHDGQDNWIYKYTGRGANGKPTMHNKDTRGGRIFYWIVTAVSGDFKNERRYFNTHVAHSHANRFSIRTLGIKNGNPIGLTGTFRDCYSDSGWTLVKKPPRAIIEEGSRFIGEVYENAQG